MTDPNRDVVMARAATLEQSMDNLRDEFERVQGRERTNRRLLVVLGAVAFLSVVAIVITIVVAVQANTASDDARHAVSQANINRRAQIATCVSSNDSRKVALQLWDFLLAASLHGNPPPTGKIKTQLEQFQRMVNAAYKPRDCSPSALASSPSATPTH